ncbi:MAG TPA: VWA domain-containing protein [Pirellulales bacterium]
MQTSKHVVAQDEAERRSLLERVRDWLASSGPWTLSALMHLLIVVALGLVTVADPEVRQVVLDVLSLPATTQEDVIQELPLELAAESSADMVEESEAVGIGVASAPTPSVPVQELATNLATSVRESQEVGPPVLMDIGQSMTVGTLAGRLSGERKGEPAQVVDGYDQAFDLITAEILEMLSTDKVLLVWCFDQSESMQDDVQEIRSRIDHVYEELGISKATDGDVLWSAVVSYGSDFRKLTEKPTADVAAIQAAMDAVPVDPTGKEYMCGAVGQTLQLYKRFAATRQLAVILVTDESGELSDKQLLEPAIAEAKRAGAKIYVLGREAVFGYPYARIRWKDPKTDIEYWIQIDRGPEAPFVEQLQTDGFHARWDAHPSGFGPYEQCRLARETNGVFFLLPSLEANLVRGEKRRFELEAMKPYLPDLGPREQAIAERSGSPLRTVLWKVINDLNPHDPQASKYVNMRIHFSVDPVVRAREIQEELVKAETLVRYFRAAEEELAKHQRERDREDSPRWQANYDLIYAQTVCYQVRLFEYGAYLDGFLKKPLPVTNPRGPSKPTTHWTIGLRKETLTAEKTKTYVERADALFRKVISDHPGTPWAARAAAELQHGYGVNLWEDYIDPRRGKDVNLPNL